MWTEQEIGLLISNHHKGWDETRRVLPYRSLSEMKKEARKLEIVKKYKRFSLEETEFIKSNRNLTSTQIANHLNVPVSIVRSKIWYKGLKQSGYRWSSDEIERLRGFGGTLSLSDMAKHFPNRAKSSIRSKINTESIRPKWWNSRKTSINHNAFDGWTKESAYWMGFIAADGSLSSPERSCLTVTLSIKDYEHLCKLANFVGKGQEHILKSEGKGVGGKVRSHCCLNFVSQNIYDRFVDLGIRQRKTYDLDFPNVPDEFLSSFILGYSDGDGSVQFYKTKNKHWSPKLKWYLVSIQKKFLVGLIDRVTGKFPHISGFKINVCLPSELSKNTLYNITLHARQAEEFLDWLYKDQPVFLERKHEKYLMRKKCVEEKKRLKLAIRENVKNCYLNGYSLRKSGKIAGVCHHTVSEILKEEGMLR